jgi:transcriptional regulator with GAF, ATPase, and Fis domain
LLFRSLQLLISTISRRLKRSKRFPKTTEKKRRPPTETRGSIFCRGIVGEGPNTANPLQIEQVAQTDTAVLILGETGVGKNMVAAAIHRRAIE